MKDSLKKNSAFAIIVAVGLAAGLGYLVMSGLLSDEGFSSGGSDNLRSGFLFSDVEREENPDISNEDFSSLVGGNTEFATDLYQEIRDENGNLFYSPYSISLALAMTYAGAEGDTASQMADTLNFDLDDHILHRAFNRLDQELEEKASDDNFSLEIANSFWGQENYHFENSFLDVLALNYGAGIRLLDFFSRPEESRLTINEWVENKTEERIKDLIPPGAIDSLTRAVLANAIYFNASWMYPFEESDTAKGTFTLLNGEVLEADMMSQTETLQYAEGEDYQVVELPYQGRNDMSMLLIKPDMDRFSEFDRNLDRAVLDEIVDELGNRSVSLKMPKFEYEHELGLGDTLSDMGMPVAFGPDADFSGMTGDRSLYIDDVLHKAFVSVDEKGTEAAAATAVIMREVSAPKPAEIALDSPFIFLIRDRDTETILFIGRVMNPNA
ncbi:MAG: serpin family protein [Candidatus Hadarchaeia archaeon]